MHHWPSACSSLAAPLLLTGCLWGPGKFASDLTLRKDGTFVLDYRGEIVLQTPPDAETKLAEPWSNEMAHCYKDGRANGHLRRAKSARGRSDNSDDVRPCTAAEIAKLKTDYEEQTAERANPSARKPNKWRRCSAFPGFDDESNRAFAAKLMKYAGWRSVAYRGKGVFDVDYHFEGRATQDFLFPMLPDNDLLIPFVAIRRRADGSVLVTAPAFTGGAGPLGARAGAAAAGADEGRAGVARAGPLHHHHRRRGLTNNSEDGRRAASARAPASLGRGPGLDENPGGPDPLVGDVTPFVERAVAHCDGRLADAAAQSNPGGSSMRRVILAAPCCPPAPPSRSPPRRPRSSCSCRRRARAIIVVSLDRREAWRHLVVDAAGRADRLSHVDVAARLDHRG